MIKPLECDGRMNNSDVSWHGANPGHFYEMIQSVNMNKHFRFLRKENRIWI